MDQLDQSSHTIFCVCSIHENMYSYGLVMKIAQPSLIPGLHVWIGLVWLSDHYSLQDEAVWFGQVWFSQLCYGHLSLDFHKPKKRIEI